VYNTSWLCGKLKQAGYNPPDPEGTPGQPCPTRRVLNRSQASKIVKMPDWKQHEGELAGGEFPLERYLAGSEAGAHFLTRFASGRAVVKLVLASRRGPRNLWSAGIAPLPCAILTLVRIFAAGTWTLAGMPLAYFVMEYAERNLAGGSARTPGRTARPGHGAWRSETFEYSGGRRHSQTFQRHGVGGRPGGGHTGAGSGAGTGIAVGPRLTRCPFRSGKRFKTAVRRRDRGLAPSPERTARKHDSRQSHGGGRRRGGCIGECRQGHAGTRRLAVLAALALERPGIGFAADEGGARGTGHCASRSRLPKRR